VEGKVSRWVKDVEELSIIAKDEPQLALSAFSKALCHRWTFIMRTIPDIDHLFEPLEHVNNHKLIPALTGREVSEVDRQMLSLPVRLGGMGILNPMETASREYAASTAITEKLKMLIEVAKSMNSLKKHTLELKAADVQNNFTDSQARHFKLAQEK
jgi:hypothetical protein